MRQCTVPGNVANIGANKLTLTNRKICATASCCEEHSILDVLFIIYGGIQYTSITNGTDIANKYRHKLSKLTATRSGFAGVGQRATERSVSALI